MQLAEQFLEGKLLLRWGQIWKRKGGQHCARIDTYNLDLAVDLRDAVRIAIGKVTSLPYMANPRRKYQHFSAETFADFAETLILQGAKAEHRQVQVAVYLDRSDNLFNQFLNEPEVKWIVATGRSALWGATPSDIEEEGDNFSP